MSPASGASVTDIVAPAGDRLARILDEARLRFSRDRQLRRRLPGGGSVFVDRRVPFLALHREGAGDPDPGASLLARSFASYVVAPPLPDGEGTAVTRSLLEAMVGHYGTGLLIELWSAPGAEAHTLPPVVGLFGSRRAADLLDRFAEALDGILMIPSDEAPDGRCHARVEVRHIDRPSPPDLSSVAQVAYAENAAFVALQVPPVYRRPGDGAMLPGRTAHMRRALSEGVESAVHEWTTRASPSKAPAHRHALARRHLGRTARAVASRLADVASAFDLVLDVSPVNSGVLWSAFDAAGRARIPKLVYRPLSFDPEALKRSLFVVPLERIEDPVVAALIREKQEELDLRISMLRLRGQPEFRLGSLQIFGRPDQPLLELAREILESSPDAYSGDDSIIPDDDWVDAHGFVAMARDELERYRGARPDFPNEIEVRSDLTAGLLVTRGVLCVNDRLRVTRRRARGLIQHEIGTHVLTYYNGSRQPLKLLASGLAHYGPLQEGLAVLTEYLVGGLTVGRCRTLAERVLAVEAVVDGADFVEAYRSLEALGVEPRKAFHVVLRAYRGGGLTKDAQYLAGLRDLLGYLGDGGDTTTLFVGKIGLSHIHLVDQLVRRGTVLRPAVEPHYLRETPVVQRLESCRGRSVLDLFEEASP